MALSLPRLRALRLRARAARLDRSAASPEAVVDALTALHATDPATLHLSVWARLPPHPVAASVLATRAALQDRRSIARILAMRRTLHVVPRALVPASLALARARLDGPQRKRLEPLLLASGLASARSLQVTTERIFQDVLSALDGVDLDTDALGERAPVLQTRCTVGEGKPYAAEVPLGRVVLEAMGNLGLLLRAREVGGWRQGRCTWARVDQWYPGLEIPPPREAYRELLRAWLRSFGPATPADAAWWHGLPLHDITQARQDLGAEVQEVAIEGLAGPFWMLADTALDGLEQPAGVSLLPGLDPSIMACKERSLFLEPGWYEQLFDRNGNAGPTIWLEGRVVGGWACDPSGQVVTRALEPLTRKQQRAVDEAAFELSQALAGERVQPRFPVPLSKELGNSPPERPAR
jgi:hypothetical protein